jgi:thiol:disulfide interchange protein DsbC
MLRIISAILLSVMSGLAFSSQEDIDMLRETVKKIFPGEQQYAVSETPVPGLYEVDFGDSFMYITADASYAVKGDIINVNNQVNLTERKRSGERLKLVNSIGEDEMIVFSPKKGKKRFTITVFTDIDCGYCRRLHNEIDKFLAMGIEVRYLFYPRAGIGSQSYKKAVSVWCADDRKAAMTLAKQGGNPGQKTCDNPVRKHMKVAKELGVTGTPLMILDDGSRFPGYTDASRLLRILEHQKRLAAIN